MLRYGRRIFKAVNHNHKPVTAPPSVSICDSSPSLSSFSSSSSSSSSGRSEKYAKTFRNNHNSNKKKNSNTHGSGGNGSAEDESPFLRHLQLLAALVFSGWLAQQAKAPVTHADEGGCGSHPDPVSQPVYSREEVERHCTAETGIWVTYKGGVYDVTAFLANHPGGASKLMLAAGKDLTSLWKKTDYQQHFRSPLVFELLEEMRVGSLRAADVVELLPEELEARPLLHATDHVYDCIVVGSGLSGLQTAKSLISEHKLDPKNVLVLEAQDYFGGRVRQVSDFIPGVHIDVGAEFIHGSHSLLTKFAEEHEVPITRIFVWAHGDGGPLDEPVNGRYGLYYIKNRKTARARLLRFDAQVCASSITTSILSLCLLQLFLNSSPFRALRILYNANRHRHPGQRLPGDQRYAVGHRGAERR